MIKTRTILGIAILLAVLLPLAMMAQTGAPPAQEQGQGMGQGQMGGHHDHMGPMGPPSPQAQVDHLSRMLNLTDEQKAKILPIFQDADTQAQALRQDTSLSPQDRRTKMRDLHEKAMAQVRPILTADQQAKFDQMKQRHGSMHKGGMGQGMGRGAGQQPPPPPPPPPPQ